MRGKKRGGGSRRKRTNGASSSIFIEEEKRDRDREERVERGVVGGWVRSRFLKAFNDIPPE